MPQTPLENGVTQRVTPDQEIRVEFEDGLAATISLREADMVGPEAAPFDADPPAKEWMVWNQAAGSERRGARGSRAE